MKKILMRSDAGSVPRVRSNEAEMNPVETFSPAGTHTPIGPYCHIAKVGPFISISATAGFDPATDRLVGPDPYSQTRQIIKLFKVMLGSVGSDLRHVIHVNIFLKRMSDLHDVNRAYAVGMGDHLPARTVIEVNDLPKPGAALTMNLTAVVK